MFCFKLNKNCSPHAKLQHVEKEGNFFPVFEEITLLFGEMVM